MEAEQPFEIFTEAYQEFFASLNEFGDCSRPINLRLALINPHYKSLQKEADKAVGMLNLTASKETTSPSDSNE